MRSWLAGKMFLLFLAGALTLQATGCSKEETAAVNPFAPPPGAEKKAAAGPEGAAKAADASADEEKTLGTVLSDDMVYTYNPIGKRDPFAPARSTSADAAVSAAMPKAATLSPLQSYPLADLKVTGILVGIANPRALVETPDGKGHVVMQGTLIGPNWGKISTIEPNKIIVEEDIRDAKGEVHKDIKELTLGKPKGDSDEAKGTTNL